MPADTGRLNTARVGMCGGHPGSALEKAWSSSFPPKKDVLLRADKMIIIMPVAFYPNPVADSR